MELFWAGSPFGWWEAPIEATQWEFTINGFSISSDNVITNGFSYQTATDLNTFSNSLSNGKTFISKYERNKNITFDITIKGSSRSDFLSNMDAFRKAVYQDNVNIDIKFDGTNIRRITWNCISAPVDYKHYNINFMKVSVSFETLEPHFYALDNDVRVKSGVSANFIEEITWSGTLESDLDIQILFQTGLSGVNSVTITDGTRTMIVWQSISDSDVLEITSSTSSVKLNWTEIDFDGEFLQIEPKTNFIDVQINGTWSANFVFLSKKVYV